MFAFSDHRASKYFNLVLTSAFYSVDLKISSILRSPEASNGALNCNTCHTTSEPTRQVIERKIGQSVKVMEVNAAHQR